MCISIWGCGKTFKQEENDRIAEERAKRIKDSIADCRTFVIRPSRVNGMDCLIRYSNKKEGVPTYTAWILNTEKSEVFQVEFWRYKIKLDPNCKNPKITDLFCDFEFNTLVDSDITIISNKDIIDICAD